MRPILVLLLVVAGATTPVLAGEVIFTDGWESGSPCSWASEFAACGVGTEMVITLPGDAVTMTFMYVPPGTFWMGSPEDERGRYTWEDLHEVTLTQGYYVGKYEVTQGQWEAVLGTNPWDPSNPPDECPDEIDYGIGPGYPVYCVNRNDIAGAGGFVEMLNAYLSSTGQTTGFRLPTDAEWERAARAGTQTRFSHGDVLECDDDCGVCAAHSQYMWWCGDKPSGHSCQPVGSRQPNGFGLYDMHGSVWEWAQDWWQHHLGTSPATDPTGPATGSSRVTRGGGWAYHALNSRSASRYLYDPTRRSAYVGFRLAMTAN